MKKIAILGSTGSIGTQTLDVVRANGDIEVLGISAGRNVKMLEEQAREFHPQLIAVWDENAAKDLEVRSCGYGCKNCVWYGGTSGACVHAGIRNPCHCDRGNDRNPSYHGGESVPEKDIALANRKPLSRPVI